MVEAWGRIYLDIDFEYLKKLLNETNEIRKTVVLNDLCENENEIYGKEEYKYGDIGELIACYRVQY